MKQIARVFFATCALVLQLTPAWAQATQSWSPYGWVDKFDRSEYYSSPHNLDKRSLFWSLKTRSFGADANSACKNGAEANHRFQYGKEPRAFSYRGEVLLNDDGIACQVFDDEYLNEWVYIGSSDDPIAQEVTAVCESPALLFLSFSLLGQSEAAYNEWSREYQRGLPKNLFGYPSYNTETSLCQCPTGAKLHSSGNFCVKMPDIVIGFFNGVANTKEAARQSRDRLEAEYGDTYKDTPLNTSCSTTKL
jgi:hypothetical protein